MAALEDQKASAPTPNGADTWRNRRIIVTAGAALSASWLVPIAANALRVDLILPVLLLLGTASLLRAGHTLLDRLVVGAALLTGLLIVAGMLFSLWPWGIAPVPVAGFCSTVLTAVGLGTRRRPQLPRLVRGSDLIVLAAPMATWLLARRPVTGKSFAQMLPFTAADSDYFNHFALFDAIRRIGGYPFLKPDQSRPFESTTVYPPGTHYLYALIDVFRTSSSDPGDSVHEFLRFNQYHALGLSLLSFTVVWAARWIAGPSAIGWHRALVCAVVAAFTVLGQLSTLFPQAFVAEIAGLVLLALTIALLARPPSSPHEQVLVSAALLVALTFVYPIFLVDAGFAIVFALLVYQSRIRRIPRFTAALTIVTATLCAFPLWQTLHVPNVTRAFALSGFFIAFSRPISVIFALFGIGALFTATRRRLPTWQVASPVVALACAVALYAELAGTVATGSPQYYSSKMVAAALVISLCGFGGVTLFFKSLRRAGTYSLHDALIPDALCVVLAILLPVAQGHANIRAPRAISDYASAGGKFGDGVPTAVVTSRYRETNRGMTMFLAVLNHQAGTMDADALDVGTCPPSPQRSWTASTRHSCSWTNFRRRRRIDHWTAPPQPLCPRWRTGSEAARQDFAWPLRIRPSPMCYVSFPLPSQR